MLGLGLDDSRDYLHFGVQSASREHHEEIILIVVQRADEAPRALYSCGEQRRVFRRVADDVTEIGMLAQFFQLLQSGLNHYERRLGFNELFYDVMAGIAGAAYDEMIL